MRKNIMNRMLMIANILNAVEISKISVPELVQSYSGPVTLDCEFPMIDSAFQIKWMFNNRTVYEWSPGTEPKVYGIMDGRLDLRNKSSNKSVDEEWDTRRKLRILEPSPELSGEYTCILDSKGKEDKQARSMLIYSPEHDFVVSTQEFNDYTEIKCFARGLFPQPVLVLEINQQPIAKQDFRVWRNDMLYETVATANITKGVDKKIVCKLLLPQAGYLVIKEYNIRGKMKNTTSSSWRLQPIYLTVSNIIAIIYLKNKFS